MHGAQLRKDNKAAAITTALQRISMITTQSQSATLRARKQLDLFSHRASTARSVCPGAPVDASYRDSDVHFNSERSVGTITFVCYKGVFIDSDAFQMVGAADSALFAVSNNHDCCAVRITPQDAPAHVCNANPLYCGHENAAHNGLQGHHVLGAGIVFRAVLAFAAGTKIDGLPSSVQVCCRL